MINDVTELALEAARISGRTNLPQIAPMLLGFLESYLNNTIRTDDMTSSASLTTDASGSVSLPADYQEAISLSYGTSKLPVNRITRQIFEAGVPGYFISGGSLVSSHAGADHTLNYYQSIPSLWTGSTNWLLSAKPEIYLRGLVFEAHKDANDAEGAASAKILFDMAVNDYVARDTSARRIDTVSLPRTQM